MTVSEKKNNCTDYIIRILLVLFYLIPYNIDNGTYMAKLLGTSNKSIMYSNRIVRELC